MQCTLISLFTWVFHAPTLRFFFHGLLVQVLAPMLILISVLQLLGLPSLPSPSSMTIKDIKKIAIEYEQTKLFYPNTSIDEDTCLHLKTQSTCVLNITEADTMARVVFLISSAVCGMSNVQIQLQPSIADHKTFTDVYVLDNDDKPLCFMEVKRQDKYTDLMGTSDVKAQALREAHILLCECNYNLQQIPFVLTNSLVWSFGLAEKVGNKIKLTKVMNILFHSDGRQALNAALKSVLRGTFPS